MKWGNPAGKVNRFGHDRGQVQLQRRLLRLVTFLILILVMMRHASNPGNWNWFWSLTSADRPNQLASVEGPAPILRPETERTYWIPGLQSELLKEVRDDSHFRKDEYEVWFHLWDRLKATDGATLKASSCGHLSYLQLYRQMPIYRGQVCELRGTIRRTHRVSAPENQSGIAEYWQCWLFLEESPTSPIVLYLLHAPHGWNEVMEIHVPVEATVCAFKRWAYARGDTLLVAPVVMAADVTILSTDSEPIAAAAASREANRPTWPWILGVATCAILLASWMARPSKKEQQTRDRLPKTAPPELAQWKPDTGPRTDDTHESL